MVDLVRLRDIVRRAPRPPAPRELTYEPVTGVDTGADPHTVGEVLGGVPIETSAGPCLVIDRRYEAERWHGRVRVADCLVEDGESLGLLDRLLPVSDGPRADSTRVVFLDLETTGLSGGAGTVAFLVGCGYFDAGAFQVRQFLLTSFAAERALLAAVGDFLASMSLLVTYNGKAFDVPIMETRWLFHRMEPPFAGKRHFDMLHPARRLWRDRDHGDEDSDCTLGALERRLIGFERTGDVPGFEIPSRYFQFLRTGDARALEAVLEHNRLDLVSLAALVARGARLVEGGAGACAGHRECLAVGKVLERAGRLEPAAECYRHAVRSRSPATRADAIHRLALLLRRQRRFEEAAEAWRTLIDLQARTPRAEAGRRQALEALAIHLEHRTGDLRAARAFALEAFAADTRSRWRDAVRHRLDRLDRKLSTVREKGGHQAAPLLPERRAGDPQA